MDDVAWKEEASLYQQPRTARVFATLNQVGGNTDILLGDDGVRYYGDAIPEMVFVDYDLMRSAPAWITRGRVHRELGEPSKSAFEIQGQVVICGFGRVGSLLGTALDTFGVPYVVVELNPEIIKALRSRGVPCIFGDAGHLSILERTHVDRANLVVVTVPDKGPAMAVVRNVRGLNPAIPIIARAHQMPDREELLKYGATQVIQPEIEASATLKTGQKRT